MINQNKIDALKPRTRDGYCAVENRQTNLLQGDDKFKQTTTTKNKIRNDGLFQIINYMIEVYLHLSKLKFMSFYI